MSIKQQIVKDVSNIPGWRTNRKLVVFESDDWGSIRMPSKEVLNQLIAEGLDVISGDAKRYNENDTLASKDDLSALFELLSSFKGSNGQPPVFTAVSVVANPDFSRIKEQQFQSYFYEPFTKTLERYYGDNSAFLLWKEGMKQRLFKPQFHAREHLNIAEWMRALRNGNQQALHAFKLGFWGFRNKATNNSIATFQAAYDFFEPNDLTVHAESIKDGLLLFEQLFGYKASFFVPPNGPFNNQLEAVAAAAGIKYMSAAKLQIEPQGYGVNKRKMHWIGKSNQHHQIYITRNCFFEPSQQGKDWIAGCLNDMESAFRWHKPAIISSHRVNYVGALNESNRILGLTQLKELIRTSLKKWPEIEFITTDQLGDMIIASRQ